VRGQILDTLFARMGQSKDPFFLTADMGINLVERFQEAYPERFLNVGIAEQNLIGVSSGLANLGFRPFAYTISNFLVIRALEQVRNDIAIHDYPITLLGIGTGYDNSPLAPTHHILDDWGMVKALGRFEIYCPSSVAHAAGLVDRIIAGKNPVYVRIPKASFKEPASADDYVHLPGDGKILLISYGNLAQECLKVREQRPETAVLICNQLHPLATQPLADLLASHRKIIVVEDHFAITGLFSSVCQFAQEHGLKPSIHSLAPTEYRLDVGKSPAYYHHLLGLDAEGILRTIDQGDKARP
jgi:transketolase